MGDSYIFEGVLIRRENGAVVVEADTPEDAAARLAQGEWVEYASYSGGTEFEWNGQEPRRS